jgi:hypothetical protein
MRTIEFIDDSLLSGLDNEAPPSEVSTSYPTVHPGAECGLFGV